MRSSAGEGYVERTTRWIDEFIVGRNVCPFAREPRRRGRVGVRVCEGETLEEVIEVVCARALALGTMDEGEEGWTEVIVTPSCDALRSFDDMLDAAEIVEEIVRDGLGLDGVIQIVAFHPEYRFAGEDADDPAAFTNRSPWPSWHVLREADVSRAVRSSIPVKEIPVENARALRAVGFGALVEMLRGFQRT